MSTQHAPDPVIWIHEAEALEHLRTGLASYCRLGADSNYCWNTTDMMHMPKHLVPLYDKSVVDSLLQQRDELWAKCDSLLATLKEVTQWTKRYTAPDHPITIVCDKAIAKAGDV